MRLFKLIPVCAAALAVILVPIVSSAQAGQATDTSKETAKKARRKKAKQTDEAAGEAAGQPAAKDKEARSGASGSANRAMPTVSESDIASAKASGKVWVNTETGVYHKGGRWYGATKQGKFMTEDDAIKAGYRASKGK